MLPRTPGAEEQLQVISGGNHGGGCLGLLVPRGLPRPPRPPRRPAAGTLVLSGKGVIRRALPGSGIDGAPRADRRDVLVLPQRRDARPSEPGVPQASALRAGSLFWRKDAWGPLRERSQRDAGMIPVTNGRWPARCEGWRDCSAWRW